MAETKPRVIGEVKSIEDVQRQSIQSRADRDSADIGLGGVGGIGGLLTYMFRAGELVSPWWSTQRDIDLRRFVKSSDHLSGAVALLTSKVANVPVRVEPRDYSLKTHVRHADEYTRRLMEESELGQGWITLASKVLDDWFCTDCGLFIEVTGAGRKDGPIQGPATGLLALDSTRVIRKKDPEFPIGYIDEDGSQYKLHRTRVAYASDQPSNIVEMRGTGFCSVSRSINVSQNLVDMAIYKQEKLGSRPMRAIMFTPGIPTDVVQSTLAMSEEMMDNQSMRRMAKIPVLGGHSTDARFELISLSSLPDGFDEETSTRLGMFAMALAFGVPIRWLWPASTSGATKADAMYQHIAGLGGGVGRILKVLTLNLGGDPKSNRHTVGKFLPPHLKLVFDFQDDEQDRMQAEIRGKRMETMAKGLETGVLTLRVAREKALEAGDISDAQFEQMELSDGRLASGEDVLTLFYSSDGPMRSMLDLGIEDPLDIQRNDQVKTIEAIEDKMGEVRKAMTSAGSVQQKSAAKQALAALGKLMDSYKGVNSAQEQAIDAETDQQGQGEDQPGKKKEPGKGAPPSAGGRVGQATTDEEGDQEQEGVESEKGLAGLFKSIRGAVERPGETIKKAVTDLGRRAREALKGGPGSGHHGHQGRPGQRGGSAPSGGLPSLSHMDKGKLWIDSLTDDEIRVIHSWGANGHSIRKLQSGEPEKIAPGSGEYIRESETLRAERNLPIWEKAIDRGVSFEGTVYRGLTDVPLDTIKEWMKPGTEIELRNDQSSSKDALKAKEFSGRTGRPGRYGVVWSVDQKSGIDLFGQTNVWYGDPQTGHVAEFEVVLRKGARYRVTGWDFIVSQSAQVAEWRRKPFPWKEYFSEHPEYGKDNWPEGWTPYHSATGYYEIRMEEVG